MRRGRKRMNRCRRLGFDLCPTCHPLQNGQRYTCRSGPSRRACLCALSTLVCRILRLHILKRTQRSRMSLRFLCTKNSFQEKYTILISNVKCMDGPALLILHHQIRNSCSFTSPALFGRNYKTAGLVPSQIHARSRTRKGKWCQVPLLEKIFLPGTADYRFRPQVPPRRHSEGSRARLAVRIC